jgi:hypothetical protein
LPFAGRFIALLLMAVQWPKRLLAGSRTPFSAVAQTVDFDLGKSKMLYLSMGLSPPQRRSPLYPIVRSDSKTQQNNEELGKPLLRLVPRCYP